MIREVGGITLFVKTIFSVFFETRGNLRPIIRQTGQIAWISLGTVAFAGVFVGAILVLQFNAMLTQYDAQVFLGGLNTSAVVREVGPLIISFLLAAKIGAFTTAELATMRVTEQIDAIECLGTQPIQYLIIPRFFGIVAASLLLLIIGLAISVVGSIGVASALCGINPLQYLTAIPRFVSPETLMSGFFKSFIYGTIVAAVACYKGYTASGGARGVGLAVTQASIYTNLYIVIANFVSSQLIHAIREAVAS